MRDGRVERPGRDNAQRRVEHWGRRHHQFGRVNFGAFGSPAGRLSGTTGSVVFGGNANNSVENNSDQAGAAGTFTIGSGITVHGKNGQVINVWSTGTILNQGTISADVSGGSLFVGSANGSVVNQGTFATDGGNLTIDGTFSNSGLLRVTAGTLRIFPTANLTLLPGSNLVVTGGTAQLDRDFTQQPKLDLPAGDTLTGNGNFTTPPSTGPAGRCRGGQDDGGVGGGDDDRGHGAKTLSRHDR